jgi:hypothetical protein
MLKPQPVPHNWRHIFKQLRKLVEQFPENHDFIEQSACQQIGAHGSIPDNSSSNDEAEVDFLPMFAGSMRIILCSEVTVVGVEHALTCKICFVCPWNVL